MFTLSEVAAHNTQDSCWIILYEKVSHVSSAPSFIENFKFANFEGVTGILNSHPGGAQAILRWGGREAIDELNMTHPPETIQEINQSYLGPLETQRSPSTHSMAKDITQTPLSTLLNLDQIEAAASKIISKNVWGYYLSAADDKYSSISTRRPIAQFCFDHGYLLIVGLGN
ncbi:uncharacterized protein N7500_000071 [Penicillium coprophilum]|uniref:uncharacterized protein n=1 Tax=Penicillium coprophilum TaxID=36646 RepID=UPI002398C85B|nr:uncharacterized protein N7500_000071 [Penicillium coprophilum]KAJ5177372.1 hypothetical protein N7500_000071 [Penicillium coprophilum]